MPETLMNAVLELEAAYEKFKNDPEFKAELARLYREYANRPSLLYYAEKMTKDLGGCKIYLKREDLNHTPAPTKSTTFWDRFCWRRRWAKSVLSPKPAQASTVLRLLPQRR